MVSLSRLISELFLARKANTTAQLYVSLLRQVISLLVFDLIV